MSPFHDVPPTDWIASNEAAFAIWDRYPVNPGHALVVPHLPTIRWWDLTAAQQMAVLDLAATTRAVIDDRFAPDGYNVGFNDGTTAGQTVDQFHLHLIPRYHNDVTDPRGGIRHVITQRANYLSDGGRHP